MNVNQPNSGVVQPNSDSLLSQQAQNTPSNISTTSAMRHNSTNLITRANNAASSQIRVSQLKQIKDALVNAFKTAPLSNNLAVNYNFN